MNLGVIHMLQTWNLYSGDRFRVVCEHVWHFLAVIQHVCVGLLSCLVCEVLFSAIGRA